MSEEKFESLDESFKKETAGSKLPVPEPLLRDFSSAVMEKIRERQIPQETKAPRFVPWLVPTFAVLVLASAVVWRMPLRPNEVPSGAVQVMNLTANVASIADEIAALRELDAWTEEDDASAEI